jgi:hypothetical protein
MTPWEGILAAAEAELAWRTAELSAAVQIENEMTQRQYNIHVVALTRSLVLECTRRRAAAELHLLKRREEWALVRAVEPRGES